MLEVKDREKVVGYMCFSNLTDNSSQLEKPSCLLHKKDYFLKIITGFIRFFIRTLVTGSSQRLFGFCLTSSSFVGCNLIRFGYCGLLKE